MRTVDDKVYAVSHSVGDKVYSYGPGTYLGAKVVGADPSIPLPAGFMGEALAEIEGENPLIRLDTGEYIWGCECWWGGGIWLPFRSA